MWCTKCGQQVNDHDKFCFKCGKQTVKPQNRQVITETHHQPQNIGQHHTNIEQRPQPVKHQQSNNSFIDAGQPRPKSKKKKGVKVFKFAMTCVLVLVAIVGLVGGNDWLKDTRDRANGMSNTENTQSVDPIKYGVYEKIQVNSYGPMSGTFGTIVTIEGAYLDRDVLEKATIDGIDLVFRELSTEYINLIIPIGCQSGLIELHYANEVVKVGQFDLETIEKAGITKQKVGPSNDEQVITGNGIQIRIPQNTLEKEETLEISEVTNLPLANIPFGTTGAIYDISIGDRHEFEDYLTIEIDLPDDLTGEPLAFYYNEESNIWVPVAFKVNDKNDLEIRTDHLSLYAWASFNEGVMSSDRNFMVMYNSKDYHAGKLDTVREIAEKVAVICEESKASYERQLPESYHRKFTSFGFHSPMIVYVHSDYTGSPHYNPVSETIKIPTYFDDINHLEQMVSHELFHSYQNVKWSAIKPYGKMGNSDNLWGVEALAELAAYRLSYPNKYGIRSIEMSDKSTDQTTSMQPYTLTNRIHEYDMACFIDYLLMKSETEFSDLWINVGGSSRGNIESMFYAYFEPRIYGFTTLESAHRDFWRSILTDSEVAFFAIPEYLINPTLLELDTGDLHLSYESKYPFTQTFYSIKASAFDTLSPIRIICVTYDGDQDSSAFTTTIPGATGPSDLNKYRLSGGAPWKEIYTNPTTGENGYQIHRLTPNEKLILVSLDQMNKMSAVQVTEIEASSNPLSIDQVVLGTEYTITLDFKNIFPHVQQVVTEVDYGDGSTDTFEDYLLEDVLHVETKHVFNKPTKKVITASLFDVTDGKKELVAVRVIPLGGLVEFEAYATPNNVTIGESIRLEVHPFELNYSYSWNLGDGTITESTKDLQAADYTYKQVGTFAPKVTVYDENGNPLGSASVKVYIDPPEEKVETSNLAPTNFDWIYGTWMQESVSYGSPIYVTLKPNGKCTLTLSEDHTEETTYDSWVSGSDSSILIISVNSELMGGGSYISFSTDYPNLLEGVYENNYIKVE